MTRGHSSDTFTFKHNSFQTPVVVAPKYKASSQRSQIDLIMRYTLNKADSKTILK